MARPEFFHLGLRKKGRRERVQFDTEIVWNLTRTGTHEILKRCGASSSPAGLGNGSFHRDTQPIRGNSRYVDGSKNNVVSCRSSDRGYGCPIANAVCFSTSDNLLYTPVCEMQIELFLFQSCFAISNVHRRATCFYRFIFTRRFCLTGTSATFDSIRIAAGIRFSRRVDILSRVRLLASFFVEHSSIIKRDRKEDRQGQQEGIKQCQERNGQAAADGLRVEVAQHDDEADNAPETADGKTGKAQCAEKSRDFNCGIPVNLHRMTEFKKVPHTT